MSDAIETIRYKGHVIELIPDEDATNPRDRDWGSSVGEILYTSSRYALGDRQAEREEIEEITQRDDVIFLPVYAYIHGCTRLSTTSWKGRAHHADWDSGQCGIIWCTKDKALKEWDENSIERCQKYLAGEVETFDQYLNGEVVGYVIEGPYCEDSCWGFYPEDDNYAYCIEEAKRAIGHAIARQRKKQAERRRTRAWAQEQAYGLM